MNTKTVYKVLAITAALIIAAVFILTDIGLNLSPLTKLFVILAGVIIGLQCIPATLAFIGMAKGTTVNQPLRRNGASNMKARKILIADRNDKARKEMATFFENSHYEVETTASAAYAIAKIVQNNEPIVILGDSFEEKIASVDVIALMRKCNKNLRIILVSDDSSLESLRRVREDGIFYHALRPHTQQDNEELRSAVECAVEGFQPVLS